MKVYVNFIKSTVFQNNLIKCVVTNVSIEDIQTAHNDVYKQELKNEDQVTLKSFLHQNVLENGDRFDVYNRIPVYNEGLFLEFLKKLPKIHNPFVSVSFDGPGNMKSHDPHSPNGFFFKEQEESIVNLVNQVNSLNALVSPPQQRQPHFNESYDNNIDLIVPFNKMNENNNTILGTFESIDSINPHPFSKHSIELRIDETQIFHLQKHKEFNYIELNKSQEVEEVNYNEFLFFNKGYSFYLTEFIKIFPEFNVKEYFDFPVDDIAEKMFIYRHNLIKDFNVQKTINDINIFIYGNKTDVTELDDTNVTLALAKTMLPHENGPNFNIKSSPRNVVNNLCVDPNIQDPNIQLSESLDKLLESTRTTRDSETINMYNNPIEPSEYLFPKLNDHTFEDKKVSNEEMVIINRPNIHIERKYLVKKFIDERCRVVDGSKLKSSMLYSRFKDFYNELKEKTLKYNPFEDVFNQTVFSLLMKELSNFSTSRSSEGIFWQNLVVNNRFF